MKCLSLTQPWAELLVRGEKKIETRSWGTPYRGPLAIQAAKTWTGNERMLIQMFPFREALVKHATPTAIVNAGGAAYVNHKAFPLGAVVGVVELVDCVEMTPEWMDTVVEPERSFGGYAAGRFAWIVREPRALRNPVPVRGALGIFELPLEVEKNVRAELEELVLHGQAAREDFEERAGDHRVRRGAWRDEPVHARGSGAPSERATHRREWRGRGGTRPAAPRPPRRSVRRW